MFVTRHTLTYCTQPLRANLEKSGVDDIPVVHSAVLVELRLRELLDSEGDVGESSDRFGRIQAVLHELPDCGVQRLASLPQTDKFQSLLLVIGVASPKATVWCRRE